MTRDELITQLRQYFQVSELVCPHTHSEWDERSWQFLDTAYLENLLVIRRDILQAPMTCNHGAQRQRGLRCNMCDLVAGKDSVYLSSHLLGKAGDFTVKNMTAQEARDRIKKQAHLLPHPLRIEGGVSWLHIDVLPQYGINSKVYEFKG